MLISLALWVSRFLNFSKKTGDTKGRVAEKGIENISPGFGGGADGELNAKFERLRKEGGYGYFTHDSIGAVSGVGFEKGFDYYQDLFKDAEVTGITCNDGVVPVLSLKYRQDGEEKVMFTRSHTLLAALSYCLDKFFEEARTPSENLSGWDKDRKTPC